MPLGGGAPHPAPVAARACERPRIVWLLPNAQGAQARSKACLQGLQVNTLTSQRTTVTHGGNLPLLWCLEQLVPELVGGAVDVLV